MAEPYIGQIEIFAFDYAPRGWAQCTGQLLPINQNQALFSMLGTRFGGNGVTNFALPDLRGRVPMGLGSGAGLTPRNLAEVTGTASHTLSIAETPAHGHTLRAIAKPDTTKNTYTPDGTVVLSQTTGLDANGGTITFDIYADDPNPDQAMDRSAVGTTGGQPHSNMMPYVVVNFCIALQGLYPSRS